MQNERKHLNIPYLPELDSMNLDEAVKYLDEKGERQVIDNLNWKDQFPYKPLTAFTIAHSGTKIYIDFFTRCNYLRAVNDKNNSDVYQDSCVEFFVAPHGEAPYYNFEFNCIGTIHDAWTATPAKSSPTSSSTASSVLQAAARVRLRNCRGSSHGIFSPQYPSILSA